MSPHRSAWLTYWECIRPSLVQLMFPWTFQVSRQVVIIIIMTYLCVSNDADDGAVAFQLGKVLINLLLPGLIHPLHCCLRESLLLGPVPTARRRPWGAATIAALWPQEGETLHFVRTLLSPASPSRRPTRGHDLQSEVVTSELGQAERVWRATGLAVTAQGRVAATGNHTACNHIHSTLLTRTQKQRHTGTAIYRQHTQKHRHLIKYSLTAINAI